jgi:hypothetical protein
MGIIFMCFYMHSYNDHKMDIMLLHILTNVVIIKKYRLTNTRGISAFDDVRLIIMDLTGFSV